MTDKFSTCWNESVPELRGPDVLVYVGGSGLLVLVDGPISIIGNVLFMFLLLLAIVIINCISCNT